MTDTSTGAAIAAARVVVAEAEDEDNSGVWEAATTTTDSTGFFSIVTPSSSPSYYVSVAAVGYETWCRDFDLNSFSPPAIGLESSDGVAVWGQLTPSVPTTDLSGVRIEPPNTAGPICVTDSNGCFAFSVVADVDIDLVLTGYRFVEVATINLAMPHTSANPHALTIGGGASAEIAGVAVRFPSGAPVATGTTIQFWDLDHGLDEPIHSVRTTSSTGAFASDIVLGSHRRYLVVAVEELRFGQTVHTPASDGALSVSVPEAGAARIDLVLDEEAPGSTVGTAELLVLTSTPAGAAISIPVGEREISAGDSGAIFDDLAPGSYEVVLRQTLPFPRSHATEVVATAGATVTATIDVPARLPATVEQLGDSAGDGDGVVAGNLIAHGATAPPDVTVSLVDPVNNVIRYSVDLAAAGPFSIAAVAPGTYEIVAIGRNAAGQVMRQLRGPRAIVVNGGGTATIDVDVYASPAVAVRCFEVELRSNPADLESVRGPLSGVTVELRDGAGTVLATAITDAVGSAAFGDVPPQVADVAVSKAGLENPTPISVDRTTLSAEDYRELFAGLARLP